MDSRVWARPTGPCEWIPWSSGPRWARAAAMRPSSAGSGRPPSRRMKPAMPHISPTTWFAGAWGRGGPRGNRHSIVDPRARRDKERPGRCARIGRRSAIQSHRHAHHGPLLRLPVPLPGRGGAPRRSTACRRAGWTTHRSGSWGAWPRPSSWLGIWPLLQRLKLANRADLGYGASRHAFLRALALGWVLGVLILLALVVALLGLAVRVRDQEPGAWSWIAGTAVQALIGGLLVGVPRGDLLPRRPVRRDPPP